MTLRSDAPYPGAVPRGRVLPALGLPIGRASRAPRVRRRNPHRIPAGTVAAARGGKAAMPQESTPIRRIHERPRHLDRQGAVAFLTVARHGLVGAMKGPVDGTRS